MKAVNMLIAGTRKKVAWLACCGLLLLAAGCEPGRFYLRDRGADFADIWRANVAVGPGLGIVAFATQYLRAGAIFSYAEHFGMVGREVGFWREARGELELIVTGNNGFAITPHGWSTVRACSGESGWEPNPLLEGRLRWGRTREVSGPAEFGLRAHLLLIGAEMGVRFDEAVDFVAGLWGADPRRDDSWTRLHEFLAWGSYQQVLELSPGEPYVSNAVQALLAEAKRAEEAGDMDHAMSCYEAILAHAPCDAARSGAAAIESDPHMHLAFLLQRGRRMSALTAVINEQSLRREAAARSMLEEVIRLAPDSPEAEEARALLETIHPHGPPEARP